VLGDHDSLLTNVAAPGCADALTQTLQAWDANVSRTLPALNLLIDDDAEQRAWGEALLVLRPDLAAALLGSSDESIFLLSGSETIVHSVQYWEQRAPDDPTAWRDHLASVVCVLLWLPCGEAAAVARRIDDVHYRFTCDAYAAVFLVVCPRYADVLSAYVQRTELDGLAAFEYGAHQEGARAYLYGTVRKMTRRTVTAPREGRTIDTER